MPYVYHGMRYMANSMTEYNKIILKLEQFMARRGINYSLENFERLLEKFGNPHRQLPPIIHIAGTNGKGSTAAFLEAGLLAKGKSVGVYSSPHLVSYTERYRLNGMPISEAEFTELFGELLAEIDPQALATEFELLTMGAFLWFLEHQPDVIILETGLGGRLDATNVVTPLVSVITRIDFDHQAILGHTLEEIAFEKAGIIKPNGRVVTLGNQPQHAMAVISKKAALESAQLWVSEPVKNDQAFDSLKGMHQCENAGLALKTLDVLGISCDEKEIGAAKNPGRFERISSDNKIIIRDGAHNPSGIKTLIENLKLHFPNQSPTFVTGVLKTKDVKAMLDPLLEYGNAVYYIDFWPGMSFSQQEIGESIKNPKLRFLEARPELQVLPEPFLVVTGSLHFIGTFSQ